jgi:hypothetical protein
MGQAAREALGFGAEYRTALPADIVQLDQQSATLKKTYQSLTDQAYAHARPSPSLSRTCPSLSLSLCLCVPG